jgi:hypothetical protein
MRRRLDRLRSSCACGIAAAVGLVSLGCYVGWRLLLPAGGGSRLHSVLIGLAVFLGGAAAGKLLGLLALRLAYRRELRRYLAVAAQQAFSASARPSEADRDR